MPPLDFIHEQFLFRKLDDLVERLVCDDKPVFFQRVSILTIQVNDKVLSLSDDLVVGELVSVHHRALVVVVGCSVEAASFFFDFVVVGELLVFF